MNASPITAYLSLGGNIGDPSITIEDALSNLSDQAGITVNTRSPFYKTPPWGKTDQAEFVNACALITTTLPAQVLLDRCLEVERRMGRFRGEIWGPRIIDIDILTYGNQTIDTETLKIPHPYMGQRAFVLVPLADIAPDFTLEGKTIDQMIATLDTTGIERMDQYVETIKAG